MESIEEASILTVLVDRLLGQPLIGSDSIEILSHENRELEQQLAKKESNLVNLKAEIYEQRTSMKKFEVESSTHNELIKRQEEQIVRLEKALGELQ